jgi:hypothetical protein
MLCLPRKTSIAVLALVSLLCATPALSQTMTVSYYSDGAVAAAGEDFELMGYASIDDPGAPGCNHFDYFTTTTLVGPSNQQSSSTMSGQSSNTSMMVEGDWGYWNLGTDAYFTCDCGGLLTAGQWWDNIELLPASTYYTSCEGTTQSCSCQNWACSSGAPSCGTGGAPGFAIFVGPCMPPMVVYWAKFRYRGTGLYSCTIGFGTHTLGVGACT